MSQQDLVTISPDWLRDPAIQSVLLALCAKGARARFVGGCVRNALIGAGSTDIDIAIDVPPDETVSLLKAAGLKAIPTGIEHGTITTLAGELPLEVTSLRRDVETDGRRAVVAFTDDWAEDAARRDFTMNALYADGMGQVFDPLGGGLPDLGARQLRFIGVAEDRIREDYLRILRYFRFSAWYAERPPLTADLAACAALKDGIAQLARERIGAELRKLLAAPDPGEALEWMAQTGVLRACLPGASLEGFADLIARERMADVPAHWPRRLLCLMGGNAEGLRTSLRLSNNEAQALARIARALPLAAHEAGYRCGLEAARDALLLRGEAVDPGALQHAADARLPISAADLLKAGIEPGPALGAALKRAEDAWVAGGFAATRADLLAMLTAQ
ncbi:MAG: CCA tRNA nucleotidyltransferase [Neomegalonema sp.]|nr:CCA tRNA nucleotidyltransferase [Neomegalonema sp.]